MRIKYLIISILIMTFLLVNNLLAEKKEGGIEIIREQNLISAVIKHADIEAVLEKISKEFDFEYKIFPEMQDQLITANFKKNSLLEGIKKILQHNSAITFDSNGKIIKVYILNTSDKNFAQRNEWIDYFINKKTFSLDQLKEIVMKNVQQEHPQAQLFTLIPHEDIEGNLRSYVFSYYIDSGTVPSLEKVKNDINDAFEFKKEAKKYINEAYSNRDSSTMIAWIEKSKHYDTKSHEEESYVTVEIAATYDYPPVMMFHKGLPYDLIMYPKAVELLGTKVKDISGISFTRTFKIGSLALGFEFKSEIDDRLYWVDVSKGIVFDKWEKHKTFTQQKSLPEKLDRVKKQWETFIEL